MKVLHMLRRLLCGERHTADIHEAELKQKRLAETDVRLHDQATRLHVLEWEAYGRRRQQPERQDH